MGLGLVSGLGVGLALGLGWGRLGFKCNSPNQLELKLNIARDRPNDRPIDKLTGGLDM